MHKTYKTIDVMKLFFANCIVILHSYAYEVLPGILSFAFEKAVLRLAVPFFFVVSGFFLGKKIKRKESVDTIIKVYVNRLLVPLLFWGGLNTLLEIHKLINESYSANEIVRQILKHIIFYPYGAMWYVYASVIGIVLLRPFLKSDKLNIAMIIGTCLYLFALLCNNYYFVAESVGISSFIDNYMEIFVSARNGLFVGFFMLALGIKTADLEKLGGYTSLIIAVISYLMYLIEIIVIHNYTSIDDGALYITHIIFIPSFVLFISKIKLGIVSTKFSKNCRNLSTGIYFQHRMWLAILSNFGFAIMKNSIVLAFTAIVVSIVVCRLVYKTKDERLIRLFS